MLVQNMKRMHLRPSVNFLKAVLSSAVKLIIKIGQQITVAKFSSSFNDIRDINHTTSL